MSEENVSEEQASEEPTTHRFEAEVEQVLRLVIESLYSNREVFIRELISNAADALDKLRFRGVTEPELALDASKLEVRLIPDRDAGTLTIWDNGVGMTEAELIENLGTIAKSGTRELVQKLQKAKSSGDMNLIGQFGVGFYSAYLVAERVEVVSRGVGTDIAHRWISDAKESFTIEPAKRDDPGTSVTLHLKEEHHDYLDPVNLRQLVERYSDYLSWPIQLRTTKKEDGAFITGYETINHGTALWQRPKKEIDDDKAAELYKHLTHDFMPPIAWRHFKVEGTQLFAGILFIPKQAPMTLYMPDANHGIRLYVKRVFIMDEAKELIPSWLRFMRGIVDSEDLPLNISRELLQDSKIVRVIQKQIVKQSLATIAELAEEKPEEYLTFWKSFGPVLKEGLHAEPQRADAIASLLRFETSETEGLSSLAEVKERMKEDQKAIYYMLGESKIQVQNSPHIEALKKRGIEVLYLTDPVDPFSVDAIREFDGVPLKSASEAGSSDDRDDAVDEARETQLSDLTERVRVRLQDHISEVRLSTRMIDSPVCLVIPEGGLQPHLERILRAAQQDMPVQKRILELNPTHPVIENLRGLLESATVLSNEVVERVDEWIELLYDQAKIAEGSALDDPAQFNRRVTALLQDATERMGEKDDSSEKKST